MRSLFEQDGYNELLTRLDDLKADTARQWGKMTPSQMMEHTARVLEMAISPDQPLKQMFIGRAIAWIFRKDFVGEKPFAKNAPTGKDYVIADEIEFESTRARLREMLGRFHAAGSAGTDGNVHPFFGKLSGDEWGVTQYKHVDHHLRQFGV